MYEFNMSKDTTALVGTVLYGNYLVLRQTNANGVCKRCLTKDNRTGELRTVYIYDKAANDEWLRSTLAPQVSRLRGLQHPGLACIVDLMEDDACVSFAQEYAGGQTLADKVQREGAQDGKFVVELMKQLCDSLTYLHALEPPTVYCNLSPFDIVLTPDGTAKLLNFSFNPFVALTHGYTALEQFGKNSPRDARADICALGKLMHYLLTAVDPIYNSTSCEQPVRAFNPAVPEALEAIVTKCVDLRPENRYQSAAELRQALIHSEAAAENSVRDAETDNKRKPDDIVPEPPDIVSSDPFQDDVLSADDMDSSFHYATVPHNVTEFLCMRTELQLLVVSTGETLSYADQPVLRIGRSKDCDIVLSQAEISRSHAKLYHEGNTWYLADIGSKNGVWLNGDRLRPQIKYELRPNDVIDIARQEKLGYFPTQCFDPAGNAQEIDREMFQQPDPPADAFLMSFPDPPADAFPMAFPEPTPQNIAENLPGN